MHTNAQKSLARIEADIGEPLRDFLHEQYDQYELSFREISHWLAVRGISVSYCTLYRWYSQLCGCPRSIQQAMRNRSGWFAPMGSGSKATPIRSRS